MWDVQSHTHEQSKLAHLVVHLFRAVEHVDHDAQRSAQVFGGLGLPCACGAWWSAAHGEVKGLRQRDVASFFKREQDKWD